MFLCFHIGQVDGCLQYSDKIIDGFYLIHGMDVYTWTISTDLQNVGMIPSFESLMSIEPSDDLSILVVAVDKSRDPGLRELQNRVASLSNNWITTKDATDQLANLVCNRMGSVTCLQFFKNFFLIVLESHNCIDIFLTSFHCLLKGRIFN